MSPQSPLRSRSPSPARGRTRSRTPLSRSRSLASRSPPPRSYTRSLSQRSRSSPKSGAHSDGGERAYSRSPSPPPSAKIVVEKLTKNVTVEHLREIFGLYGPIEHIDLPLNPAYLTNRGTAYIIYEFRDDATSAISNMHGGQIDGAAISVSIIVPRKDLSPSPPPPRRMFEEQDRYGNRPPPQRFNAPPGRFRGGPRRGSPPRRPASYYRNPNDSYYSSARHYDRSRSRSPPPSLSRSRSRSRSWVSRTRSYRNRGSPPRDYSPPRRGSGGGGPGGGGRRRRSPSYSSYGSYDDRQRSRSRSRDRDSRRRD